MQIGQEWVSEKSGGLNRYFSELLHALPSVGVGVTGLVTGSSQVAARSAGAVRPFAPLEAGLPARLRGVRTEARRALRARPGSLLVAHFALYAAPCLDLTGENPLVVHFQGPWAAESRMEGQNGMAVTAKRWIEARVYRRAARLLVLSRAFGQLLAATYGVDPGVSASCRAASIPGASLRRSPARRRAACSAGRRTARWCSPCAAW